MSVGVSVPYEITLLSNTWWKDYIYFAVSVPYEITLLSNKPTYDANAKLVSVPYEITLLSNRLTEMGNITEFQYLMKLHYSQTIKGG